MRPGAQRIINRERGVALIIVLLITALLIALVFEFAYGTRVSLQAAMNFRDSQRAFFLARSGPAIFIKYKALKDNLPQGEWGVIPLVSASDTELRIRWEDEGSKINIQRLQKESVAFTWLTELFSRKSVSQEILDILVDPTNQRQLVTELHRFMKDEDYNKIAPYVTFYANDLEKINANYASEEVLWSVATTNPSLAVSSILSKRKDGKLTNADISGCLSCTLDSKSFKVYFFATVGGYTKQIETVIDNNTPVYWRSL